MSASAERPCPRCKGAATELKDLANKMFGPEIGKSFEEEIDSQGLTASCWVCNGKGVVPGDE